MIASIPNSAIRYIPWMENLPAPIVPIGK